MERHGIQSMMVEVTGRMPPGARLQVVKSAEPHCPRPRAYSPAQVRAVAQRQDARNALATEIAHASGIRAHELLTLGRPDEQRSDDRRDRSHLTGTAAEDMKFAGRDGVVYTVAGKGGLVREVLLPHRIAERLEARRQNAPTPVVDRGVRHPEHAFDVGRRHGRDMHPPRLRQHVDRHRRPPVLRRFRRPCVPRRGCPPRSGARRRGSRTPRCLKAIADIRREGESAREVD